MCLHPLLCYVYSRCLRFESSLLNKGNESHYEVVSRYYIITTFNSPKIIQDFWITDPRHMLVPSHPQGVGVVRSAQHSWHYCDRNEQLLVLSKGLAFLTLGLKTRNHPLTNVWVPHSRNELTFFNPWQTIGKEGSLRKTEFPLGSLHGYRIIPMNINDAYVAPLVFFFQKVCNFVQRPRALCLQKSILWQ